VKVIWTPQEGPQKALIACPVFEIFYGGARGGGKTEGSVGDWLEHSGTYGEQAVGVFFRRKFKQLEEVVARTKQLYPQIGAKYNEQKAEWAMPGGGRLKFRYIERDSDAQEYQGHSYTRVYVEELTNFPTSAPVDLLRGTLRSATGVPVGMRCTGNPGGPGHHWVKARYITPDPRGWRILKDTFAGLNGEQLELERVFIPSKISDNALLYKNDPFYVARLRQAGSEALVRAWLEGNWDLVDGAFFDCWDPAKHVLSARDWLLRIPEYSYKVRAFDWGFGRPFSVGWYAVSDGTWGLPKEALVKYREWYGTTGKANEGLRMTADMVAKGIRSREVSPDGRRVEVIQSSVADPSIFVRDGGPSIGETMMMNGTTWRRADNSRIAGWEEMRRRLKGTNERPLLYFLDSCDDSIRTIPTLQIDQTDPEDLDTESEDHAADECRYACMARPLVAYAPENENTLVFPKLPSEYTIDELIDRQRQRRLALEEDA
jgi:hypothetical protein